MVPVSSSNPGGPPALPQNVVSPTTAALRPGSGLTSAPNLGSPRRDLGPATPLSPSVQSRLEAPLKMGDFYTIDSSFKSLSQALRPSAQGEERFRPGHHVLELESCIQTSMRDAEACYKRQQPDACLLHLRGAKSNQVLMLSIIDKTPDAKMPAAIRTVLRDSCSTLGSTLSEMLIKAKRDADEAKKLKEASRRTNGRGHATSPPSSPVKTPAVTHVDTVSPAGGSQKRAQGEAHSPVLPQSASKRQKTGTSSAESSAKATTSSVSSTTSTTTTTAVLQSPPSYRPTSELAIEQTGAPASPFAFGMNPDTDATGSPATKPVPPRKRFDTAEQAQSDASGLNQRY